MSLPKSVGGAFHPTFTTTESGNLFAESDGLSLRDWFAGQSLCGLLAAGGTPKINGKESSVDAAAYAIADAMLAERSKGGAK